MFARNVSVRLKPNTSSNFKETFEKEIVPMLRKQAGFRDEITMISDDGLHVTAISLWDTKEQAETYNSATYPSVLKTLENYLDGAPKLRLNAVISSTAHKLASASVVAA
jgi:hypothetical protein